MPGTAAAISAVPLNEYDTVFSMFDWPVHKYLRSRPQQDTPAVWTKAKGEMQSGWVCLTTMQRVISYTSPNTTSLATTGIPPLLPVSVSV